MTNELTFKVPFSGFTTTDFVNCFASTYMFLEKITGDDDYDCKKRNGQQCDGCENCRNSTANVQEDLFFLFDTMCGRSSLRSRFGLVTVITKLGSSICSKDTLSYQASPVPRRTVPTDARVASFGIEKVPETSFHSKVPLPPCNMGDCRMGCSLLPI